MRDFDRGSRSPWRKKMSLAVLAIGYRTAIGLVGFEPMSQTKPPTHRTVRAAPRSQKSQQDQTLASLVAMAKGSRKPAQGKPASSSPQALPIELGDGRYSPLPQDATNRDGASRSDVRILLVHFGVLVNINDDVCYADHGLQERISL